MKSFRLSIISLVISLIAISLAYFRPSPIEIDMFNSIITILALLITLLIGYQIFQIIDFKQEKANLLNEVDKKIKATQEEFDKSMLEMKGANTVMYSHFFQYYMEGQNDYGVLSTFSDIVINNSHNEDLCKIMLRAVLEYTETGITFKHEYEQKEIMKLFEAKSIDFLKAIDKEKFELLKERLDISSIR
ncbi:hypothetical protein [Riemerella anatipestifer]|nr:hypothetical protein [Riemerella anatipestifer]